eukprot:TRINITY_DN38374_c0_g1_i1.p1 TRINITY_DN38374_c0_g1~~TRINITY_DN38374_c0_g1_i1.p1  ORF type:complete len:153 (+),score=63.42 TRINITY_DN38374_c0_g1_i1:62-520(+)
MLSIEVVGYQKFQLYFFFFSSRRRHTRCREVSWARRCVQETGINAEYMGIFKNSIKGYSYDIELIRDQLIELKEKLGVIQKENIELKVSLNNVTQLKEEHQAANTKKIEKFKEMCSNCLLYTSDAADDTPCVDLGGRRIIKKKKKNYSKHTS